MKQNQKNRELVSITFITCIRDYLLYFIFHIKQAYRKDLTEKNIYRTYPEEKPDENTGYKDLSQHLSLPASSKNSWISSVIPGEARNTPFLFSLISCN